MRVKISIRLDNIRPKKEKKNPERLYACMYKFFEI